MATKNKKSSPEYLALEKELRKLKKKKQHKENLN